MKFAALTLAALTFVWTASGSELDASARTKLLDHLNQSSARFLASVKGLTAEQWNYKPAPEVWSVAECAEHIALTEGFLREMVEKKVLAGTAKPSATPAVPDEKVLQVITDRSFKAKAPEVLQPKREFATPEAAVKRFQENRAKTVALAKSRTDFRDYTAPHPAPSLKELDAYQWLLYLSGHTMRHTAQIQEVKASSGFPK